MVASTKTARWCSASAVSNTRRRLNAPSLLGGRPRRGAERRNDLCLSMNKHSYVFTEGECPGGKTEG